MDRQVRQLAEYITGSRCTVAVTGAGISFSAGGMSFGGTSSGDMKELMALGSRDVLENDPGRYYRVLDRSFLHSMFSCGPTPAHRALAKMEEEGYLSGIITTNIDCLHTMAGSRNVMEIQGSLQVNRCMKCGRHYDSYDIWAHGKAPRCEVCGGSIWSFPFYSNIGLNDGAVARARQIMSEATLIMVIGSNGPYGSAYWGSRRRDAKVVQINPGRTAFDREADINIREGADTVLREVIDFLQGGGYNKDTD